MSKYVHGLCCPMRCILSSACTRCSIRKDRVKKIMLDAACSVSPMPAVAGLPTKNRRGSFGSWNRALMSSRSALLVPPWNVAVESAPYSLRRAEAISSRDRRQSDQITTFSVFARPAMISMSTDTRLESSV